jgi:hypothetical protein
MEVKIILILLIIHLLGIIIFKPKMNILSCGIFGWAGKSYKTFNKAKFDIQGLYNDSRGGDSCGVTTDGEIYYGLTGSKHYSDFLHKNGYESPLMIPTVIGHTRKSSSGTVNTDNAHPFGFGDYEKSFEFVGVHNGTLHNQAVIAKQFDLNTSVEEKNNFGISTWKRNKIDSEILLEIIYLNKNFKVLSDYIGGAALLFTNTLEPNVLYAFKGASRLDEYDKGVDLEERPLYYYKESKNSLYISSLQESLEAIGGVANENLFSLNPNTVYKITDGNIDSAEKFEISRRNAHQRPATYKTTKYSACGYEWKSKRETEWEDLRDSSKKESGVEKIQEEKEIRIFKSPITFNKLRYHRNGHLINGICVWIKDYGFHLISQKLEVADKEASEMIGQAYDMEYGFFAFEKNMSVIDENVIYPFTVENKKVPGLFYFYDGIMLETRLDYSAVNQKVKNYNVWDLSEMSKHPIIEINKSDTYHRLYNQIIFKRVAFTGNISPLSSSKIYYINQGDLTKTDLIDKKQIEDSYVSAITLYNKEHEGQLILDVLNKDNDEELIKKKFTEFCKLNELEVTSCDESEDKKIEIDKEEDLVIRQSVDVIISPVYLKVQESISILSEFEEKDFIKEIIEINEDYLNLMDEIIVKNYK